MNYLQVFVALAMSLPLRSEILVENISDNSVLDTDPIILDEGRLIVWEQRSELPPRNGLMLSYRGEVRSIPYDESQRLSELKGSGTVAVWRTEDGKVWAHNADSQMTVKLSDNGSGVQIVGATVVWRGHDGDPEIMKASVESLIPVDVGVRFSPRIIHHRVKPKSIVATINLNGTGIRTDELDLDSFRLMGTIVAQNVVIVRGGQVQIHFDTEEVLADQVTGTVVFALNGATASGRFLRGSASLRIIR